MRLNPNGNRDYSNIRHQGFLEEASLERFLGREMNIEEEFALWENRDDYLEERKRQETEGD